MRILFVCQYYPPEMGAPAARVSELATIWSEAGHQVTVLTGFPNHPTGRVPEEYRKKLWRLFLCEQFGKVRVQRSWLAPFANRKTWERILNYTSFALSAALRGTFLPKPELVIATSPQLLVGLSGWWISKMKRVPFILEIRDLWPESLAAVGVRSEKSPMVRVLDKVARFLYRSADHIVTVTPAMRQYLIDNRNLNPDKISVVENGVNTELFAPGGVDSCSEEFRSLTGKFIVSCIGTIGNAHNLATIVDAAKILGDNAEIAFLIVGEGADKERIRNLILDSGLTNIVMSDQQVRTAIPDLIRMSDACLVLLKKSEVFETVIPTKLLEFMACARPVILGVQGQAKSLLDKAQAGICIEPENAQELAAAIKTLYADHELRNSLGANGRTFIERNLSRRQTAEQYLAVISDLCEKDAAHSFGSVSVVEGD